VTEFNGTVIGLPNYSNKVALPDNLRPY
jgi:hypothetical protein